MIYAILLFLSSAVQKSVEEVREEDNPEKSLLKGIMGEFERIQQVGEKLKELELPMYRCNGFVYFVAFDGTARELRDTISLSEDEDMGTGIVVSIDRYSGYASKDLWEWLETYGNGREG